MTTQNNILTASDNEYVILLKYAICLNIDLSTFLTLWAVLSVLTDTQDGKCEYVKLLQEEYNTYYTDKSRKYMLNLEKKVVEIQNCIHDSVTQNFDRVSDLNDNGLTSLQGQQDEQPEHVNIPGNAIDDDVVDIMTLYPPWSPDTNDRCDINQIANDRNTRLGLVNAEKENEKLEEVVMSNNNIDNAAMSDNNADDAALGNDNTENDTVGETSTNDVPSPLLYGRKTTDPSKVKTSKKCRPIWVKPLEPSIADPPADEITTDMVKGHTFDPTDVQVYEFFIRGALNPKDLEGVEEDQLLGIEQTIQEKLKERDEERERNITKRMKQYEEKYDFINKALLESVAQITEMTKSDTQQLQLGLNWQTRWSCCCHYSMVANLKWPSRITRDSTSI